MADKPKYEAYTSPAGIAVFPWIVKADTKFDATGKYHTGLAVEPADAQSFIEHLERVRDEFIASLPAAKRQALNAVPVYSDELSRPEFPEGATDEQKAAIKHEFVPEPTGRILFKFNLRKRVNLDDGSFFEQEPTVVSAENDEPITGGLFDGSIIRIRGPIVPYTNAGAGAVGVTLRMKAVQVIEQVGGAAGSGSGDFWTEFPTE